VQPSTTDHAAESIPAPPTQASANSIRAKHPDRIPVIVDKRQGDSLLPDIDKVRRARS
jgi:hypothetical protein